MLLCLPALGVGWQSDDYFHRVVLRGDVETGYSPLELFSVMRHGPEVLRQYVDLGLFPWWTSEELRLAFFRYLSSATQWLDYRLWPNSAPAQHARVGHGHRPLHVEHEVASGVVDRVAGEHGHAGENFGHRQSKVIFL